MGINGSGKTTLGINLAEKLNEIGIEAEYLRGSDYFILESILRLFGRKTISDKRKKFSEKKKSLFFYIWPYFVFFDSCLNFVYYKSKRKVIVTDRYFYDFLMTFEYLGYSNKVIRRLFLSIPKPDLGYILDLSPEIAKERKKGFRDFDIEFFYQQRGRYLSLSRKKNIKVINTENNLKTSVDVLHSDVIQNL